MDTARTKEDTPNLNLTPTDAEEAPAAASSTRRQVLQLADSPDHEEEAEGHRETIKQAHISELQLLFDRQAEARSAFQKP